ncbi:MAG: CCA tRNA nucleotidyltransferase, partial [Bacteroidales bacterium]|nr:CCA tRNA nucleotidyltransferase [Bacteroidales bacterium]
MKFLNKKIFKIISLEAKNSNVRAYVIGGYVRDSLLKRESNDIDIVVEGSGIDLAERVAANLGATISVFRNFGTAMIKWKGLEIEFVGARKESYRASSRKPIVENGTLEDDQLRRDFTINALAFSLQEENYGELSDPFSGVEDLNKGIIRTPLNPDTTYSDDPLRMLRAIRFASQLSFTITEDSLESIKRNRERVEILSQERINEEINKILLSPKPSVGFYLLESTSLLELILPQLLLLKGAETMDG